MVAVLVVVSVDSHQESGDEDHDDEGGMGSAQSTRHAQLLRSGSLTDLVALRSSAGVKPGTSVPGMQSCEPRPRLEGALAVLASRGASAPSGRLLMVGARFPWAQAQGFMPALLRNAGWADSQAPTPRLLTAEASQLKKYTHCAQLAQSKSLICAIDSRP